MRFPHQICITRFHDNERKCFFYEISHRLTYDRKRIHAYYVSWRGEGIEIKLQFRLGSAPLYR